MIFRRALLGLKASEVELHVQGLEAQLNEKDRTIKELEHRIMRLEFDKDDLEAELKVCREILQSRNE